jgi:hypothetical protein
VHTKEAGERVAGVSGFDGPLQVTSRTLPTAFQQGGVPFDKAATQRGAVGEVILIPRMRSIRAPGDMTAKAGQVMEQQRQTPEVTSCGLAVLFSQDGFL